MTDEQSKEVMQEEPEPISFAEFLESTPPSRLTFLTDIVEEIWQAGQIVSYKLSKPEIQLHCPEDTCNGTRFFRCTTKESFYLPEDNFKYFYVDFVCSNCRKTKKTYRVRIQL